MKNIAKSLVVAGALALTGVASAAMEDMGLYLGADYKHNWMTSKSFIETNGTWFAKSYPGASLYVGSRFHENFGVELGYDFSKKKSKALTFNPFAAGQNQIKSTASFRGPRLDLNAYMPMDNCFDLIGSIGFGLVKPTISFSNVNMTAANFDRNYADVSGKQKMVLRLGFGAQYMATENIGVRGMIRLENTSSLRANGANLTDAGKKPFKDTTSLNLGAFYKF
ncbi:MAG: outer membrane beta-barrel protein [Gammaproteobacteria bacterium]